MSIMVFANSARLGTDLEIRMQLKSPCPGLARDQYSVLYLSTEESASSARRRPVLHLVLKSPYSGLVGDQYSFLY